MVVLPPFWQHFIKICSKTPDFSGKRTTVLGGNSILDFHYFCYYSLSNAMIAVPI